MGNIKCLNIQNIIKNYASVINWIRQLAKNRRRLGISVHPGPGLKLQAPSVKLSNQPVQSPSDKHPNQSNKRQASSLK